MKVDSERKKFGKDMTQSAKAFLAQNSMETYGLWMAWVFQPDFDKREVLKAMFTDEGRKLLDKAYRMSDEQEQRNG